MDSQNKEFWEEFIQIYRENNCLWNFKSKDYTNKAKRNASYEVLLRKLREHSPRATIDILKKKINNMRTSFRRELKKVWTGIGSEKLYEPTLWYYDLLLFTAQSETERKEISNEVDTENILNDIHIESQDNETESLYSKEVSHNVLGTSTQQEQHLSTPEESRFRDYAPSVSGSRKKVMKTKKSLNAKKVTLLNLAQKSLTGLNDEYDVVGKRFAYQLKGMSEDQKIIAEKLISDIMFYGQMGKLSEETMIYKSFKEISEVSKNN